MLVFQLLGKYFKLCKRCQDHACLIKVYQVWFHWDRRRKSFLTVVQCPYLELRGFKDSVKLAEKSKKARKTY